MKFTKNELAAILRLSADMVVADGRVAQEEMGLLLAELNSFNASGGEEDYLEQLHKLASEMSETEAIGILSIKPIEEKYYITSLLATLMSADGDVDELDLEVWRSISASCDLPIMSFQEAVAFWVHSNVLAGGIEFVSDDHVRYEGGVKLPVSNAGARRLLKIEVNETGCAGYRLESGDGYIVTMYNLDGIHPIWGDNLQMTPKPMRVVDQSVDTIVLRGYLVQAQTPVGWMDFQGGDYGLTITFSGISVTKCTLHMYDRGIDIEYLPES